MALSISTSNVLLDAVPTIDNPGANEVPANISDPDHSLTYTCGTNGGTYFDIHYGAKSDISYVAVSGHNVSLNSASTSIRVYNGSTLIDSASIDRDHNVMLTFPEMDFTDLTVRFSGGVGPDPLPTAVTVTFVAAGKHLSIATGEQAGFKRNWLNRHTTQRTTTNLQVGPVSSLTQRKALKGSLSLPNETPAFSQGEWQTFIDFAFEQPFFIKEVEDLGQSSYICFDPSFNTSSHGQTLALDVLKLDFTVYNGL